MDSSTPGFAYPEVVLEVVYPQGGKILRKLADVLRLNEGTKAAIGVDIDCGKEAAVSVWLAIHQRGGREA